MKKWLCAALFIVSPAMAQEEGTAYEALGVVGRQMKGAFLNRVISVTGVDGNPQPERWKILLEDKTTRGGMREVEVSKGRVTAERPSPRPIVGSTKGATIAVSRLNLDSNGAFSVARYTAEKSHTDFALASYTLRTNDRGNPVWIVTLQNETRRPLGTIHINANKGNVTRVEGMFRGRNMAEVTEDEVVGSEEVEEAGDFVDDNSAGEEGEDDTIELDEEEADDGDENVVKAEIKKAFRRTKRDAQSMFGRVRRSFEEFFYRD